MEMDDKVFYSFDNRCLIRTLELQPINKRFVFDTRIAATLNCCRLKVPRFRFDKILSLLTISVEFFKVINKVQMSSLMDLRLQLISYLISAAAPLDSSRNDAASG